MGNPLTYRDGMSFGWNGRELVSGSVNNTSISYSYNADGIRMSKTVNGVTTYYSLDGEKVVAQKTGGTSFTYDVDGNRLTKTTSGVMTQYNYCEGTLVTQKTGSDVMNFLTDAGGDYYGFTYNGTLYYYVKNAQNDVVAITNQSGTKQVNYTYDAWGNIVSITGTLASTIGQINPIRYRSYYYDTETNLYYLQTRYYSPELKRFISADGYVSTGQGVLGYNMFAYCLNNPIRYADDSGTRCVEDRPDGRWAFYSNSGKLITGGRNKVSIPSNEDYPIEIGSYSKGNIYFVKEIDNNLPNNDIQIRDFRNEGEDPTIIINDSYRITDKIQMREILIVVSEYDAEHPSRWKRGSNIDDMIVEWYAHNWTYNIIKIEKYRYRAQHVDINNHDANKSFWDHTFGRLLNEIFG